MFDLFLKYKDDDLSYLARPNQSGFFLFKNLKIKLDKRYFLCFYKGINNNKEGNMEDLIYKLEQELEIQEDKEDEADFGELDLSPVTLVGE